MKSNSYILNRYPKYLGIEFYRKLKKEELITIIRNICQKYNGVRLTFCRYNQEIKFLKRKNKMLEDRLTYIINKLNFSRNWRYMDNLIKRNNKKTLKEIVLRQRNINHKRAR